MTRDLQCYRMKNRIFATEIDAEWLKYLLNEKRFDSARVGSYYVIGIDGTEQIMDKVRFERLFELDNEA